MAIPYCKIADDIYIRGQIASVGAHVTVEIVRHHIEAKKQEIEKSRGLINGCITTGVICSIATIALVAVGLSKFNQLLFIAAITLFIAIAIFTFAHTLMQMYIVTPTFTISQEMLYNREVYVVTPTCIDLTKNPDVVMFA